MTLVFLVFDDPFIFPSHSSVLQIIYTAHAARIMTGVIVRVNQPYHSPILSGAGVFMIFFPEIDLFIISDRGDRYFLQMLLVHEIYCSLPKLFNWEKVDACV